MRNVHSGCAAAVLITCALWVTISCGPVDRTFPSNARAAAGAGNAGRSAGSAGGTHLGSSGFGGAAATTAGGLPANDNFPSATGGSTPGPGNASGSAGSSPGMTNPIGTAGSSSGTAGSSSGTAGSSSGTAGAAAMCTGQNHLCVGSCVANTSVNNCGGSCDPCTPPSGATATCDGNQCGFSCGSLKKCGSKCIPANGCCADSDCPAQNGMARQCDTSNNTCSASGCASGFKPCGNTCIANNSCCSSNDCSGTCQTCSGPGGSCVAVKNADDSDSCSGTCDSNGTCKSKRGQACTTASAGCIDGSPCVDGYCCDSACSGQCQACDIKSKQGTCSPVPSGAPHGSRAGCTSDGSACGGSCGGKSDGTCNYPTSSCGSAKCSATNTSMIVDAGTCKSGKCETPQPKACGGSLLCSNNACLASCAAKSDCVSGYICDATSHQCIVQGTSTVIYLDTSLSGTVSSKDGGLTDQLLAGDDASNSDICGLATFDTSQITKGAVIDSVTLRIYQLKLTGDPYGKLGSMKAEKVTFTKISIGDLGLSVEKDVVIAPSSSPTGGTKQADVTSMITDDFKAGRTSQFRFCFPKPLASQDGIADSVTFAFAGDNRPNLLIKWHQ